jgi:hypothetical protein
MYVKVLFKKWVHGFYNEQGQWEKKVGDYSASYGAVLVHESDVAKYKGKYPEYPTVDYSLKYR